MYLKLINNSFFFSLKKIIDELRLSFLPPLLIYLAAGTSGMTSIVGTFYVKEYLNLSASFIASLGFWITLPWALKMPIGHLVDLAWKKKLLCFCWCISNIFKFFDYVWHYIC